MSETKKHIKQFAIFYLLCFAAYYGWSYYYGLTFHQLKPVFFYNQLDVTGNFLLLSQLHLLLMQSRMLQFIFDALYFLLPLITVILVIKNNLYYKFVAVIMLCFNILYAFYFSIMSFVSIQVMLAFMTMPFILTMREPKNFYSAVQVMRFTFILFFFSSALWKIRAGGIFNIDQMSGVLLSQHNYLFLNNQSDFFKKVMAYLIEHPLVSYPIYLTAFTLEFTFVVGFFTKRFDRILMVVFLLFAFVNYLVMNINYFAWLSFLACLHFAKYNIDERLQNAPAPPELKGDEEYRKQQTYQDSH